MSNAYVPCDPFEDFRIIPKKNRRLLKSTRKLLKLSSSNGNSAKGFGHLRKTKSVACLRMVDFWYHIRVLMGFRGHKSKCMGGGMKNKPLMGDPL